MEFALSPELDALRDEALEVGRAASERAEIPEDSWITGHDREFAKELGARGWLGMTWPVEHGGGGRSALERFVVFEALISTGAPIAAAWFADRQMGPSLLQFGTDEQRERWLPGIVAGTSMWCIGMSEPDAGSNVAGIRTRAERDGDAWVVNGQKIWTSGAADADWCYLICRITWRKEPFSSPTRWATGTRTSSKNTSQKCRLPVMSTIGLTDTPGERMSSTNSDRPSCGRASGSVRQMR